MCCLQDQLQLPMQVTHQHLQQRPTAFWQGLGRRVLHFTWSSRGEVVLDEALRLQVCPSVGGHGTLPPHVQVQQACLPLQAQCTSCPVGVKVSVRKVC